MYTDGKIIELAQQRIGYAFRNPALLLTALTHSSYANEHEGCESNERLEFLGDALLNFISAKRLYDKGKNEGEMTKKRSGIVSRTPLCLAVEKMKLIELVRFGNGASVKEKNELSEKAVSDIFEAVLGAIYLDCGNMAEPEKFVTAQLSDLRAEYDYKSSLQEYAQGKGLTVRYTTYDVGNVHSHYFRSEVFIGSAKLGEGEGRTKKEAEKNAAEVALRKVNR